MRAEYPNQLDYNGAVVGLKQVTFLNNRLKVVMTNYLFGKSLVVSSKVMTYFWPVVISNLLFSLIFRRIYPDLCELHKWSRYSTDVPCT